MLKSKIREILLEIERINCETDPKGKMPQNTYFMEDGKVLCLERANGESRFPYSSDGYILWAHSSGFIHAKNGLFNVFKPVFDSGEPAVEFFAGIENQDKTYFPISLLGAAKQLFEPYNVKRYVVYSLEAAYYITETDIATFVLRAGMSQKNEMLFTALAINKLEEPINMAVTSYVDPLMKKGESDDMWSYAGRGSKYIGDGSFILSRGNARLYINRKITGVDEYKSEGTAIRYAFLGKARAPISTASCLKNGEFSKDVLKEGGGIASEIIKFTLKDDVRIDYVMPLVFGNNDYKANDIDGAVIDNMLEQYNNSETKRFANLDINFSGFGKDGPSEYVFNKFLKKVQKQVDNCAMGRYYVDDLLGIRDVYQQLEQALIWDNSQAREKMLRALSYIDPNGIAPRQISIPDNPGENPKMDLRRFIDQGNWIISCFYSYISWTGDYSILDEVIGYHERIEYNLTAKLSDLKDSALVHLLKITDYLVSCIDYEDGTNCLRILFGDWNDSLDGLGHTKDEGKRFGTGVSVMASLHFYQNLFEITEILKRVGGYDDKISEYLKVREALKDGLVKYAIDVNENGDKRIIHGWGDHMSYKIGSFKDSDGESRVSFASNSFWVSSGLIYESPELKECIISSIHALESKYGLLTLTPAFRPDSPGVGRLAAMTPGTAENACVYIHGTLFSILALFGLGQSDYAWKHFLKILPIANQQMTKTPFVMSNSYLDNPERGLCGQSVIDWYTGSGTVVLKNVIRSILGLNPDLDGLVIKTAKTLPCKYINADVLLKGKKIKFEYKNENKGNRKIYMDGKEIETIYDIIRETETAVIPNDMLYDGAVVSVVD